MDYKTGITGLALLLLSQEICATHSDMEVRIIMKYKAPLSMVFASPKQASQLLKLPVKSMTPLAGDAWLLQLKSQESNTAYHVNTVLGQLRKNPLVAYAVQDRPGHFKPMPSTSLKDDGITLSHDLQWDEFKAPAGIMLETAPGLRDGAWAYTSGLASPSIVIAVLDTGISVNNALVENLLKDADGKVFGWNFAANNNELSDETDSWHGTHVAGTIAAFGEVMLGVGEHLKILPVKIPDESGMFYESQVINAIYWSVGGIVPGAPVNPYPAKVLNMSFGVDEGPDKEIEHCDEALSDALAFVRQTGAVVTVAAGNDNRWEHYNAPAVCNGTIKVAATGPTGLRAYYSNYGPGVSFAAPGGDLRYGKKGGILSTVSPDAGYKRSGFDFYQGTSMASPHAAGVAGLVYAVSNGSIDPERVEQILYATTHAFGISRDDNDSCAGKKPCGSGILDAENAVKAAEAHYDEIIVVPPARELTLVECAQGKYQVALPAKSGNARWLLFKDSCQLKDDYQSPVLRQLSDGKIFADYGNTSLLLNSSYFKACQIIGMKGVGCYY